MPMSTCLGRGVVARPMICTPSDKMLDARLDELPAPRAFVGLGGARGRDPAHMPLPIGRVLQALHAVAGLLQPWLIGVKCRTGPLIDPSSTRYWGSGATGSVRAGHVLNSPLNPRSLQPHRFTGNTAAPKPRSYLGAGIGAEIFMLRFRRWHSTCSQCQPPT